MSSTERVKFIVKNKELTTEIFGYLNKQKQVINIKKIFMENNYSYTSLHDIEDVFNDEIDIIVNFKDDNSKFHVTFLTYQKVKELMSEEHNFILYSNTILIKSLTKENINESLKYIIDNNMYLSIFYPINDISIKKLNEKFINEKEIILE